MGRLGVLIAGLAFVVIVTDVARGQVSRPETSTKIRKELVIGQHLAEDLERKDGCIDDRAIVGYVQGIANRLARATGGKTFDVRMTRGSARYAHLSSQGVLYISGGLFQRIENEAELAGLLAHQLAHMHGTIVPAQDQSTTALLLPSCVLTSPIDSTIRNEDRRASELLATKAAVKTLRGAGYEPSAVLDLLSKLAYEHPLWAKAIFPEDLLNLRVIIETDLPPEDGYRIDSSEFKRQHARVVEALGHAANNKRSAPSLTSLPRR